MAATINYHQQIKPDDTIKNVGLMCDIHELITHIQLLAASKDPVQWQKNAPALCKLQATYHRLIDELKSRVEQLYSTEEISLLKILAPRLFDFVVSRGYWRYHQQKMYKKSNNKTTDKHTKVKIHASTRHVIHHAATIIGGEMCKRIAYTYVKKLSRAQIRQWALQNIIDNHPEIIREICRLSSGRLPVNQFIKVWQQMPPKVALLRAQMEFKWYTQQCKIYKCSGHNFSNHDCENYERGAYECGDQGSTFDMRPHTLIIKRKTTYIKNYPPQACLLKIIFQLARKLGLHAEQLWVLTNESNSLSEQEEKGRLLRLYLEAPSLQKQIQKCFKDTMYGSTGYKAPSTKYGAATEYLLTSADVEHALSTFNNNMIINSVRQPGAPTRFVIEAERLNPGKIRNRYHELQTIHIDALHSAFPDNSMIEREWALHHVHRRNDTVLHEFTDSNWFHALKKLPQRLPAYIASDKVPPFNGVYIRQEWAVLWLRCLNYTVIYMYRDRTAYNRKEYIDNKCTIDLDTCGENLWKSLRECNMWRTPTARLDISRSTCNNNSYASNEEYIKEFSEKLSNDLKTANLFEKIDKLFMPRLGLSPDELQDVGVLISRALLEQFDLKSFNLQLHPVIAYWCSARRVLHDCSARIVRWVMKLEELGLIIDGDATRHLTGMELEEAVREKWHNYVPTLDTLDRILCAFARKNMNSVEMNYIYPYGHYNTLLTTNDYERHFSWR
jgi:hypothetical protein